MSMTRRVQITLVQERIALLKRNEAELQLQAAQHGSIDVPLIILNSLAAIKQDLISAQTELNRLLAHPSDIQPYVGLSTFQESDADRFFGRERVINDLLSKIRTTPFLTVLGASGSGKSSVVLAGLLPALKRGGVAGSEQWFYLPPLKPGPRPLDTLAAMLTLAQGGDLSKALMLSDMLASNPQALLLAANTLGVYHSERRLVLVVDQAEELWTLTPSDPDARAVFVEQQQSFIQLLVEAASAPATPVLILLTMRADFLHRALEHPKLTQWLNNGDYKVSAMTADELRAAIEYPIDMVNGQFEPGMVDGLIEQVHNRPGALPLLEYTLSALWQHRQADDTITWEAYHAIGGVKGALAARADELLAEHYATPEQLSLLKVTLPRLVQLGDGSVDTRRRVPLSDLVPANNTIEHIQTLLRPFVDERLLTVSIDDLSGEEMIELSHEALIDGWPTFKAWINDARADLRLRLQVEEAAKEWEASSEKSDFLWSGLRLEHVETRFVRAMPQLNSSEWRFLQASHAAKLKRERAEQRNLLRLRMLLAGAVVFLVLALTGGGVALSSLRRETTARNNAEAQASASEALFELERGQTDRAMVLTRAAAYDNTTNNSLVSRTLYNTLENTALSRPLQGSSASITTVAFSPNGQTVLTGDYFGVVGMWNVADGKLLHVLTDTISVSSDPLVNRIREAIYSPDGRFVLTLNDLYVAHLWDVTSGQRLDIIPGLNNWNGVSAAAFSPDSRALLIGSMRSYKGNNDKVNIELWNIASSKLLAQQDVDVNLITTIAFSPDGHTAMIGGMGGHEKIVQQWDIVNNRLLQSLKEHTAWITEASYSPHDGQIAVTRSVDGIVRLWEAASGKLIAVLGSPTIPLTTISFSPNGQIIITGSNNGTAILWNAMNGRLIATLSGHTDKVTSVAFSPDGETVVTGSDDKTARVWDVASGTLLTILGGNNGGISSVAFSPDGRTVITGNNDGTARLWEIRNGQASIVLRGHTDDVEDIAFSPDGKTVLTGSRDSTVRVWDVITGHEKYFLQHKEMIRGAVYSPDGQTILTGSNDKTVRLWSASDGKLIGKLPGDTDIITGVAFSPDGRLILAGTTNITTGTARLWDIASQQQVAEFKQPDQVGQVAFSPDGKMVITGSNDGTTRLWSVTSHQLITIIDNHEDGFDKATFSPDSQIVLTVTGSPTETARLWSAEDGHLLYTIQDSDRFITTAIFSPDSKNILLGSLNGTAHIWNISNRKIQVNLVGHTDGIFAAVFSPDGKMILTGSRDRTARLWDADTGTQLAILEGHTDTIKEVLFSPDSRRALTGSDDNTARLWIIDPSLLRAELTHRICSLDLSETYLKNTIPNWQGCEEEQQETHDNLLIYNQLTRR